MKITKTTTTYQIVTPLDIKHCGVHYFATIQHAVSNGEGT